MPLFENEYLKKFLKNFSKKDIASATQKRLEEVVLDYIKTINLKKNFKIALDGGIFANVKLNEKIKDLKFIEDIFIFPNMGDGGLSVGAAALHHSKLSKVRIKKLNNIYLGKSFKKNDILKEIKKFNLKIIKNKNLNNFVASEINNGKVVAIFNGKMEFGPRSLGNRSIYAEQQTLK